MGPNRSRKVRVIAKIRALAVASSEPLSQSRNGAASAPWISIKKPDGDASETVALAFGDNSASRKETCEVDFCYEQDEKNGVVFSREVKPLIAGLFDGCNATVIACGARGSGKTYTIQGTDDDPGLVGLAMDEVLAMAGDRGNAISISRYEICGDRVYDLLNAKRREVLVLNDGQGKTQLKGLSQVPIKCLSEFCKLCDTGSDSREPTQKIANEFPQKSHRGIIIYVSSLSLDTSTMAKMNFVDLAGYEDARRKSTEGFNFNESNKINKSIYALQNVIHSLNANQSHVPYRGSTLTRMLQDSLGGTSRILMIACINPIFFQDSIYMTSLAARLRQGTNNVISDSSKKANSSTKSLVLASHQKQKHGSVSITLKKKNVPQAHHLEKQSNCIASALKERKLFTEASHVKSSKVISSNIVSTIESPLQEAENFTANVVKDKIPPEVDDSSQSTLKDSNSESLVDVHPLAIDSMCETSMLDKEEDSKEVAQSPKVISTIEKEGKDTNKENNTVFINENESPPISARIQELSNNLKLLYSSTPSYVMAPKSDTPFQGQVSTEFTEPRTPIQTIGSIKKYEVANFYSPWEKFYTCSSGMKDNLVQEYLNFLNTADKEQLMKLKGIGEKRATYILELREESLEPFKSLDDLHNIGLSVKQAKEMIRKQVGGFFN